MILEAFTAGPVDTNAYLLACPKTRHAAVIDVPFESADLIIERAKELSLSIQMILLTHSHWDHIGDAALLKKKLNVPIYIHKEDEKNLKAPGSDRLPLLLPVEGVAPDAFLFDGQSIPLGELTIQVIHTPGHTPGCVCFYLADEKTLISGDTLFRGTIGNLSFSTARPALMWDSLKRLSLLPKETRVYPGHGDSTSIGEEPWLAHAKEKFSR